MSGTQGCRVHLPEGMGVEYFIDGILDSRYGNKNLMDLIEEYEENHDGKLVDAVGEEQEKLKKQYKHFGNRFWNAHGKKGKLDKVLLQIPAEVLRQMFPGMDQYQNSHNWIVFLQSTETDEDGNPVMETVTETNDLGEKVQVERPKSTIWRIEYDWRDQFGQGAQMCNQETWEAIWGKMLEGIVEDLQSGGLADAIVGAHKENAEKSPAFKTVGAKVGKNIYRQKDPDGNDSLSFDIIVTDMYDPSAGPEQYGGSDEFTPQLDTPDEEQEESGPQFV